jgi:hypothetical protein
MGVIELVKEFPAKIWLCRRHFDLFWVSHGGTCPEPGCQEKMVEFVPSADHVAVVDENKQLWTVLHEARDTITSAVDDIERLRQQLDLQQTA